MKKTSVSLAAALASLLFVGSASAATIIYDFDSNGGDDGLDPQGWIDVIGASLPSSQVFNSGSNAGGRGTGGNGSGSSGQDNSHANLIFRSPEFSITGTTSIDFQIAGGPGSAATYANSSDVPNATSNGSGVQKFFLRRASTGEYLYSWWFSPKCKCPVH